MTTMILSLHHHSFHFTHGWFDFTLGVVAGMFLTLMIVHGKLKG